MASEESLSKAGVDIIPTYAQDQFKPLENVRTRSFFIVYALLDEDALRTSLDDLIRNHWRKLGARLIARQDGLQEYHLPRRFDEGYRLFNWSSKTINSTVEDATGFPGLPAEGGQTPILHGSLVKILDSYMPPKWPWETKQLPPDSPLLWVHLTYFSNATVVAVNAAHALCDQLGLGNIIRAWLGLLKGESPPPMAGYNEDVLATVGTKQYADYSKAEINRKGRWRLMSGFEYSLAILGMLPELIFRPEIEQLLFLPLSVVEPLRERWSQILKEKHGNDVRLSTNDVVTAVLSKLIHLYQKKDKMFNVSQAVNLRGRVPQIPPGDISFVHNAIIYSTVRLHYTPSIALPELAYRFREANFEAIEEEEIEKALTICREQFRLKKSIHVCEPFELSNFVSSWTAAWHGIDFTPAIKQEQVSEEKIKAPHRAKMVVLGDCGMPRIPRRYAQYILSKSDDGFWTHIATSKRTMKLIRAHLQRDPKLEQL